MHFKDLLGSIANDGPRGRFTKILRLRYTLGTSSFSWKNTTRGIVWQQNIVTTTPSHSV